MRMRLIICLLLCSVVCANAEHAAITVTHKGEADLWVSLKEDKRSLLVISGNGAKTWRSVSTVAPFHNLFFFSPTIGWSVYQYQKHGSPCSVISNTLDAGYSWRKGFSACRDKTGYTIAQVLFVSRQLGFALSQDADDGLLLKTKDGGRSFQDIPELSGKGQISSVLWDGAKHLLVLGRDFIGVSDDQGTTWKRVEASEGVLPGRTQFFLTRGQLLSSGRAYLIDGNDGA